MKPATTFPQVLGQVVLQRRKAKNATQHDIARKLGVTQTSFSRLERGTALFNVSQLRRTAAFLGLPVSKLFEEAEKGADALAKAHVTVLEEAPEEEDRARWAWVAPTVIHAKVQAVVRVRSGYDYTKAKAKEEEQVHVYLRRG